MVCMSKTKKKLRREGEGKVLAGVCNGLGEHFNVDPVLFRVLFILLALADGVGILAYGILWFVVPKQNIVENNN